MENLYRKALANVPNETKMWVCKSFDITDKILDFIEHNGISLQQLAAQLGKTEPEVNNWMMGTWQFDEETIKQIQLVIKKT